ncbi:MAG: hypothetical protein ACI8XX_002251 [Polaribacter sp.]|jgi:hypothetical protein
MTAKVSHIEPRVDDILHSLVNLIEVNGEFGLKAEPNIRYGLINMIES